MLSHRRTAKQQPPPPTDCPRLLTVQGCAALTGESVYTWRDRAYRGVVASVKISGPKSRLLIPEAEVHRLVTEGLRPARA